MFLQGKGKRLLFTLAALTLALGASVFAASAQEGTPEPPAPGNFPANTITVTGTGTSAGTPDVANLEVGAEIINSDIAAAFQQANQTIDAVIAAVTEAGVAPEDIRTTGLDIFTDQPFPGPMPTDAQSTQATERTYRVSNRIRVIVRDISILESVIDAAVNAGANNIFGLSFGIENRADLESQAREAAMDDARQRAEQLAQLAGAQLGEVIVISENTGGGFGPFNDLYNASVPMGGGATIEPGSLSVSVQLQVTFRIIR